MKVPAGRFDAERRRYRLAFTCERCTNWDPRSDRCAHGYPTVEHRLQAYERDPLADVVFCKDFDLL